VQPLSLQNWDHLRTISYDGKKAKRKKITEIDNEFGQILI
jgi:hypothetical protein